MLKAAGPLARRTGPFIEYEAMARDAAISGEVSQLRPRLSQVHLFGAPSVLLARRQGDQGHRHTGGQDRQDGEARPAGGGQQAGGRAGAGGHGAIVRRR